MMTLTLSEALVRGALSLTFLGLSLNEAFLQKRLDRATYYGILAIYFLIPIPYGVS